MITVMNEQRRYGDLVREAMAQKGMTQRDVAERTGWSQSVVSDILNGKRSGTPPEVVHTLERVLGLSVRRQLEALGYLDVEKKEPGVAYVIYEDDPLAAMLKVLEGLVPRDVDLLTRLLIVLKYQSQDEQNADNDVSSGDDVATQSA